MQNDLSFKQLVHNECVRTVNERMEQLQRNIEEMRAAAQESGKSSAGDKHETSRAMTDLEIEKQQLSLKNLLQMQAILKTIQPDQLREKAVPGALVDSQQGIFYIAVALGKIRVKDNEILVISPDAPLVQAMSKTTQKKIQFNGRVFEVNRIY